MKYPIGLSFINAQYQTITIVDYYTVKGELMYLLDDRGLMTDTDIEFYLNKQEQWTESKRRYEERERKEEEKRIAEAERMKEQRKYIDEYLNQFTGVKRAKIDNTLSKEELYSSGLFTRYQWIEKGIAEGKTVEIKKFSNAYNKRAKNDYTTSICMFEPDKSTFTTITKTEQDYFEWLKQNI